ncbi:DUF1648 domain-containing protein [Streptomyces sp. NPDC056987]|uniref:DUF1648 domain-containing protein n=1 Tax=Streptomyces sp. NPDC056987 TaxID=3345988 RepID=UPI00362BAE24
MNAVLVSLLVNFATLLILGAVLYAAPSPLLNPKAVPFGVRVPPDKADSPEVGEQRRRYRALLAPIAVVITLASLVLGAVLNSAVVGAVAALLLCAAAGALWLSAHRALARAKEQGNWYEQVRQGAVMDTSLRTDPVRLPWLWVVPSLVVLAATAAAGAFAYPDLPATMSLPERTTNGTAYRDVTTTFWSAFSLVFVQLGVTVTVLGTVAAVLRARPDLDVSRPRTSVAQHRRYLALTARALLGVGALLNLMLLGLSAMMWGDSRSGTVLSLVVGVPLLVAAVGSLLVVLRAAPSGGRTMIGATPGAEAEENTGLVARDDDRHWRAAGTMYVNSDDPAILVPKRVGMGWTVNLANPRFLIGSGVVLVLGLAATVVSLTVGFR